MWLPSSENSETEHVASGLYSIGPKLQTSLWPQLAVGEYSSFGCCPCACTGSGQEHLSQDDREAKGWRSSSQTQMSPSLPRPGSYGDLEKGPQELPDEIFTGVKS